MKSVKFITLGCKVNAYETEAMKGLFEKGGYTVTDSENADVIVINTCTVTQVGEKKSRQMIRRSKRENPNSIVAVVGCYSQVSPEVMQGMPEVDIILGTTNRKNIVEYVENFSGEMLMDVQGKISKEYEELPSVNQSRIRATLKIQDGCNNYCSYCIIPYARGPVRSRTVESAVSEVKLLTKEGFTEFVLVGIHLGSYGIDLGLNLIDIVKKISKIEGVKRLRLGSLEPNILTDEFIDELKKLPNLCHDFHVSMQSGCSETLKRMNRKYNAGQYIASVERLREAMPDSGISTDVIVGFPGETEEEFNQSVDTVKKCKFSAMHVFPYSKREGTVAAKMDNQVDEHIKSERAAIMIQIAKEMKKQFCEKMIGKTYEVLFETKVKDGRFEGLTGSYVRVLSEGENLDGQYKNVKITAFCGDFCEGIIEDDN